MTGAIDQRGRIQPIGAVTEKVEGFYAVCRDLGLTGDQGVIIPEANAGDLMLDAEVSAACEDGRFHVHAVTTVAEALALFTGMDIGEPDASGAYPSGTLLAVAKERASEFWRMARRRVE